jgi:hypothetical protein
MSNASPQKSRDLFLMASAVIGALLLFLSTISPGISWKHNSHDSGELTLAAWFFGVAHPTGYPSFILLAHLFSYLPFGEPAFRITLFCAVAAAMSAGWLTGILLRINRLTAWHLPVGLAPFLGMILVLGKNHWEQAIITEVYALNASLSLGALYFCLGACESGSGLREKRRLWLLGCLLWAVAVGNHLTAVFLLPGFLLLGIGLVAGKFLSRRALVASGLASIGLILVLYTLLPIRAQALTPINWGYLRSPTDLINHVSGAAYHFHLQERSFQHVRKRLTEVYLPLLHQEWGGIGIGLMVIGLIGVVSRIPWGPGWGKGLLVWLGFWLPPFGFAMSYGISDIQGYFLLPTFFLGGFLFPGIATGKYLLVRLGSPPAVVTISSVLISLALFHTVAGHLPAVDLSEETLPTTFAEGIVPHLPVKSLVLSDSDALTNSLLHECFLGKHRRRDTAIVMRTLLPAPWYRDHIRRLYPFITIPEPRESYAALDRFPRCDRMSADLLAANRKLPLFSVFDHDFSRPAFYTQMFNGIFRLSLERPQPPGDLFGTRFQVIDLEAAANADYRANPFIASATVDNIFRKFAEGLLPGKIPFWLRPPRQHSGKPSVLVLGGASRNQTAISLHPGKTRAIHLAFLAHQTNIPKGFVFQARVISETSFGDWQAIRPNFDFAQWPPTFAVIDQGHILVDPRMIPKTLEVAVQSPVGNSGVVTIFAVTQETAPTL